MDSQKKHIKFMAQKYLDSSQKKTPQTSSICKRGHRGRLTSGTPLFPDIHGGKISKETKAQGRMQFQLNTDSPGPAAYSPPTMACRETIAPSYTFGWKTPLEWPSPSQYGQLLGTKSANRPNTPNFSFGQRGELSLANKGTLDEPGPNQYNIERAYTLMLHRSPSIIINPVPVTLFRWVEKEGTPGPGAYNVDKGYNARLPRCPGFYIQGVRRPKKHETGPFSTL